MESNRRKIEKEIVKTISPKISQLGFRLVDKDLNMFVYSQNDVKWELSFYLYNNNIYSLFCKAAVRYIKLTQIINDLLINTEFTGNFDCGVGILEDELKIVKETQSLRISNIGAVSDFSKQFLERIIKIKDRFWIPQSDPTSQMESFKKSFHHWINSDLVQNVVLCISTGIKENDLEKIKFGFERGYDEIMGTIKNYGNNYNLEKMKEMIDLLHMRVKEKGYNL